MFLLSMRMWMETIN